MTERMKRKHGPSVKEESVFGFFPAAKDIRTLQATRQWESVKSLLNLMRKNDSSLSDHGGSLADTMETTLQRGRISAETTTPTKIAQSRKASVCQKRLPPLQASAMTPTTSQRLRESLNEIGKVPLDGVGRFTSSEREGSRSKSTCLSPGTLQARDKTRGFKNLTLIGYSCGEFKQTEAEYTDVYFRRSVASRPRHFYVHPEWLSEGIVARHLVEHQRPNPFRYGWP